MDPFITRLLLSVIVGATWVSVSTIIAEKVSGKIGGLILGLPTTAVVSLLFIGLTQDLSAATEASIVVPFSSGVYCFFFLTYLQLTKRGFMPGLVGSLTVWFTFALVASITTIPNIYVSIFFWLFLIILCIWWAVRNVSIDTNLIPQKIVSSPLWVKALISGVVIGAVVFIGKVAGPKWGGIFATFPALTLSSILITIKSGGVEFTRLVMKNVLISTTTTVGLFGTLAYFLFPIFGLILGSIISYIVLLLISIFLYFTIFAKLQD